MTDTTQTDANANDGMNEGQGNTSHPTYESVIDPEILADSEGLDIRQRTYTHEKRDHCEADTAGRAIVGVTDEDGRLLLLVNPEADHAVLLNDTVAPDEDWATVGQHRVKEMAGIDITLDTVERVRRADHVLDDAHQTTTYYVVFGASVVSPGRPLDGLCEDNDWELGWYDDLPGEINDDGTGVLDDIQLFLG